MSKPRPSGRGTSRLPQSVPAPPAAPGQAARETVESIAVAVILAFLFRAFVAEAFVIPTGSMAPTLMGQHKDVECPECGYWYQAGASIEIEDESSAQTRQVRAGARGRSLVVGATCPLCRHQQLLDLEGDANKATFSGDRILVSKFVYDFTSPKRWDVIVFKYPFNAKQNFIKRLIGLPGESILIQRGDIYVRGPGQESYEIARKPDRKLTAMLQVVDDSKYISSSLTDVGWPLRWQPWSAEDAGAATGWATDDHGHSYHTQEAAEGDQWLRYHHVVPTSQDWFDIQQMVQSGARLSDPQSYQGALITDFYAYNAFIAIDRTNERSFNPGGGLQELPPAMFGSPSLSPYGTLGLHWVGDLALEAEVEIESESGELLLQCVKGGVTYHCRIDVATGRAVLAIGDATETFTGADQTTAATRTGETNIRGPGRHSVRFSNVDAELRLWVDDRRIELDGPATYTPHPESRPVASPADPGDLAPVGVGTCGASLQVKRLRVLRDVYYVATDGGPPHEYRIAYSPGRILDILNDPTSWADTELFDARGTFEHQLEENQFFPMGDNSPQSSDARMWPEHFFDRELLIGRALLIYWPHPWYRPIPYMPNLKRMRLIH